MSRQQNKNNAQKSVPVPQLKRAMKKLGYSMDEINAMQRVIAVRRNTGKKPIKTRAKKTQTMYVKPNYCSRIPYGTNPKKGLKNPNDEDQIKMMVEEAITGGTKRMPTQDHVSDSTTVSALNVLSQVPNTAIAVYADVDALVALSYQWAGYCIANNIGIYDVTDVGTPGVVGMLYMFAATICYDLWVAMSGGWSIFAKFPKTYHDLRTAIMPKVIKGYSYKFLTSDTFFGVGGVFPTGFPLKMDSASLSWPTSTNTGSLFNMNTTVPNLTVDTLVNYGPDICQGYWTRIINSPSSKHSWVEAGAPNYYADSVEAFALCVEQPNTEAFRWCQFSHEVPFRNGRKWLAYLGLGKSDGTVYRAGFSVIANYQTAANYGHRIVEGISGKVEHDIILRSKYIDIESALTAMTASAIAAELNFNGVAGLNNVDQGTIKSPIYNIDAGQFSRALTAILVQRFAISNFVFADNPQSNFYVMAGTQWAVGSEIVTARLPTWVVESLAGLQRLENTPYNGRSSVQFVTYPVLGCYGSFGPNGYSQADSQINLLSMVDAMYPGTNPVSYHFRQPPLSSLPAVLDPADTTKMQLQGLDMPDALELTYAYWGELQGNMSVSVATNSVHQESTFMHLTRLLLPPQTKEGMDLFKDKNEKLIITKLVDPETDKVTTLTAAPWSVIYSATIREYRSRFPFTPDRICWVMTRIMPSSFLPPTVYANVYDEKKSSVVGFTGSRLYIDNGVRTALAVAHPIAGAGDEQVIGDKSRIEMSKGGGFFSGVGNFLDGILGF